MPIAEPSRCSDSTDDAGIPRWVKALGITIIILILLIIVALVTGIGGPHGPARHSSSGLGVIVVAASYP